MRRWVEGLSWRLLFWTALATISFLALMPWSQALPKPFQWSDKLNHFAAFVSLALLLLSAYRLPLRRAVLLLTLYGALIESIQYFLPWRSAEWADLAVDFLAASAGVLLWSISYRLAFLPRGGSFLR